jgi:Mg2+ and Co2+ transporter CorA
VTTAAESELADLSVRVFDRQGEEIASWARGLRVRLNPDAFGDDAEVDEAPWGRIHRTGLPSLEALLAGRDGVVEIEVALAAGDDDAIAGQTRSLVRTLAPIVGDNATALAHAAVKPVKGPVASAPPETPSELQGWGAAELWLLTSVSPSRSPQLVPHCRRAVRLLFDEHTLIAAWQPLAASKSWHETTVPVEPMPVHHRRHSMLVDVTERTGFGAAGRLVQDVMQHHDWTRWQLTQRVERWESQFFDQAREGDLFAKFDESALARALGDIHDLLSELRAVTVDTLRRGRLRWMPDPETTPIEQNIGSVSQEACVRSQRAEEEIDRLNGSLREGWGLLASAATGAQLEQQRQLVAAQKAANEEQGAFHDAAALVAAVVLVPGLVIGLYGADVDGLPGAHTTAGRNAVFLYSFLGALVTAALLRSRSSRHYWALGGLAAFILLTIILSAMT